nr:unnamed protein product [Digitaria exilis]
MKSKPHLFTVNRWAPFHLLTTAASVFRDGPSGANASAAFFFKADTFFLAASPFSPSITSLTAASTSSRDTTTRPRPPASSSLGRSAIRARSDSITAFILCSANSGHATTGTPASTASSVEFHPQCDTNPPTARWFSTSTCGAHCGTHIPTPLVLSVNPSGKKLIGSSSSPWWSK